jgi:ribonuclease Z
MTQLSILFLGTGGSWPTLKRNVSSIAIKRGREIILFDCGEGTQRQFQKSDLSYMQISKIFISHFHGDHFLGLPGLIQTMQLNDREEDLNIYGPKGIVDLVKNLKTLGYFKPAYRIFSHEIGNNSTIKFHDYSITAIKVKHKITTLAYCLEEHNRPGKFNKQKALSLGIPEGPLFSKLQRGKSIKLDNGKQINSDMVLGSPRVGRKIVISSDTKPCKKLIDFSKNADILIHDATFDSELQEIANKYGHSTAAQAAEIAKQAEVKELYLTHISPRYLDHKLIENDARKIFKKSFITKDFQTVDVKLEK